MEGVESPLEALASPYGSGTVGKLAAALAKAQGAIKGAAKDTTNPFFNSRYADLASIWEACREPLSANGLAITQHPTFRQVGEPQVYMKKRRGRNGAPDEEREAVRVLCEVSVRTMLLHESGEWVADTMACILPEADPQTVGSGITYLRRYGLAAMVGVAPDDDDGNAGSGKELAPINDDQHTVLLDLLTETGTDPKQFLGFFHVEALTQLPAADFDRAKRALEAKRTKGKK